MATKSLLGALAYQQGITENIQHFNLCRFSVWGCIQIFVYRPVVAWHPTLWIFANTLLKESFLDAWDRTCGRLREVEQSNSKKNKKVVAY